MVMSGNSSLSSASTSPIARWSVLTAPCSRRGTRARTRPSANPRGGGGGGGRCPRLAAPDEEHEHEPADLQIREVVERGGVDPLVVDVRAVQRADVGHLVPVRHPPDRGVATGDGDVVEEDVGLGVTAEGGDVTIEHEP